MANGLKQPDADHLRLRRRGIPKLLASGAATSRYHALAASTLFHVTAFVTLGALWTTVPHGTGSQGDRPVGIAVIQQVEGGEAYFLPESGASNLGASESVSATSAGLPNSQSQPINTDNLLEGLLPNESSLSGKASDATGGLGLGEGGPRIGGSRNIPKVKTSVFGIEGEGTRFIYVFDRSDSMNDFGGLPLVTAKSELVQSLQSLGNSHQFQIIFYNESQHPFGSLNRGSNLLSGDDRTKTQATSFVRSMSAQGSTKHIPALKLAITMGPDVIFFLTDADLPLPSVREREEVVERCARAGITIHAIQFGVGSSQGASDWIADLATQTSGKFRYIDVTQADFDRRAPTRK